MKQANKLLIILLLVSMILIAGCKSDRVSKKWAINELRFDLYPQKDEGTILLNKDLLGTCEGDVRVRYIEIDDFPYGDDVIVCVTYSGCKVNCGKYIRNVR